MRASASHPIIVIAAAAAMTAGWSPGARADVRLSPSAAGRPALAGAASANGPLITDAACAGSTATDCGRAGYQAGGRDFRYAQALITVPDQTGSVAADPALYVALDGSAGASYEYARVGVRPCTAGPQGDCPGGGASGWEAFVSVRQATLPTATIEDVPLASVRPGAGVFVSVYFNVSGNSLHTVVRLPGEVGSYRNVFIVQGPIYTRAQALADWTADTAAPRPAAAPAKDRVTQFLEGRFTTVSGQRGSFRGPWTLRGAEATSNGQPYPLGAVDAYSSYLWNWPAGGRPADAFGVWEPGAPAR